MPYVRKKYQRVCLAILPSLQLRYLIKPMRQAHAADWRLLRGCIRSRCWLVRRKRNRRPRKSNLPYKNCFVELMRCNIVSTNSRDASGEPNRQRKYRQPMYRQSKYRLPK